MKLRILAFLLLISTTVEPVISQGFPPANVNVSTANQVMLIPTAWVSGEIVSPNNSRIASEVSGRIERLAELGSVVSKGETIAKIDDSRLVLRLDEARAAVKRQKSSYAFLQSEVTRIEALAKRNLLSQTDLDRITSERDVAQNELMQPRFSRKAKEEDATYLPLFASLDSE